MIGFRVKGDFSNTEKFFKRLSRHNMFRLLEGYANKGVAALSSATPVDSGLTAASWYSKTEINNEYAKITFCNSNIQNGVPIAIILQYGHGTGTGGWVEGRDYINPAIQPIFDQIVKDAWEEVIKL